PREPTIISYCYATFYSFEFDRASPTCCVLYLSAHTWITDGNSRPLPLATMATGGEVVLRLALLLMPLATKPLLAAAQPMFTSSSACEQGHFCTYGVKLPCAPGGFGSYTEETSFLCSGLCPAGSFCPEGSSSPAPCGNSSVYCPAGSSTPIVVSPGNYTVGGTSASGRIEQAVCPKGRYCRQGLATLCPAGTFGEREGLHDDACSGPCPAGWYCPPGAIDPF
ncbi:unnamed protein product, partial [Ectocarpus sp. 13 AM-2016]